MYINEETRKRLKPGDLIFSESTGNVYRETDSRGYMSAIDGEIWIVRKNGRRYTTLEPVIQCNIDDFHERYSDFNCAGFVYDVTEFIKKKGEAGYIPRLYKYDLTQGLSEDQVRSGFTNTRKGFYTSYKAMIDFKEILKTRREVSDKISQYYHGGIRGISEWEVEALAEVFKAISERKNNDK